MPSSLLLCLARLLLLLTRAPLVLLARLRLQSACQLRTDITRQPLALRLKAHASGQRGIGL